MRTVQWTKYDGVDMVALVGMAAGILGLGPEDRDRLLGDRPWMYTRFNDQAPSALTSWLRRIGLRVEVQGRIATIRALRIKRALCGNLLAQVRTDLAVGALRGDPASADVLADDLERTGEARASAWWRLCARAIAGQVEATCETVPRRAGRRAPPGCPTTRIAGTTQVGRRRLARAGVQEHPG